MDLRIFYDKHKNLIKYILITVLIIALGCIYYGSFYGKSSYKAEKKGFDTLNNSASDMAIDSSDYDKSNEITQKSNAIIQKNNEETQNNNRTITNDMICVYVSGMVERPGIVLCPKNTRLYEVIELAGGLKEEADLRDLNLAEIILDGAKVFIPRQGEEGYVTSSNKTTDKSMVNINIAGKEELMGLPGIGESKALDIIKYREKNGGFSSIEEIMNISGIKEAAFEKIRDLIKI